PSTFSIVAADRTASELGVAVQSKFLAVGAAVPWAIGGVGAIATQAWANTTYGPRGLELLQGGHDPAEVIDLLIGSDDQAEHRQVGIVDSEGRSSTYTGSKCMEWAGGIARRDFAAQGNILAGKAVVEGMVDSFESSTGRLADRLIAALRAGQAAGGDRRGKQSAALYIVKPSGGYGGFNDRYVDLRVDDHPEPIEELARLLELHKLYFFPALPEEVVTITPALGDEIAALLIRAGELPAKSTYDERAAAALLQFMHRENLEDRVRNDGTIDQQTLGYLRRFVTH
ncbi:MAG TPA: DUF1028 domain-containing protein, partial [Candidatus Acidoferrales bacterium]|nr:DUF1028 domain-containing protein [Candidatus Acidoferrales bacterium]